MSKKHEATPYDDTFRTLLLECPRLIIPIVNEMFGEQYTGKENVVLLQNENYMYDADSPEKNITDSNFVIIDIMAKHYHIECQSTPEGSMVIRMFEYDIQSSLRNAGINNNELVINIPNSGVIYLRHSRNTPDNYKVTINAGNNSLSYDIPVLKTQKYSIEEILNKKMYFLIPFYLFTYERDFDIINSNKEKADKLINEYKNVVYEIKHEDISGLEKATIIDMTKKLIGYMLRNNEEVKEGVLNVMGGHIVDHPARQLRKEFMFEQAELMFKEGADYNFVRKVINWVFVSDEELQEIYERTMYEGTPVPLPELKR